ncbi:GreA/GreB family elongation factor [Sphingobacterium bovistauri]|uniref:GreA/GreB family elongation factor n=1 Tax=Sphingobacterium bovistauri TaxID=2781959 RepID=A0ABS7Z082_9SPHI|nr:GreA/GreB family elongation factor [Sphingobacterium bovistauri]MCA5003576.1 GreA/GreB family elongation factor [Sphingobacterium bovistauri]
MDKEKILSACFTIVDQKIVQVDLGIQDANQSLQDDTKSSAGDKYETSREMIQQDLNRYEQQLKVLNQDLDILTRIKNQKLDVQKSGLGSLVQTDKGFYFLAISIGQIIIDDQKVFCISTASPIGKILLGKAIGESFEFNGTKQVIKALY